jgi:hypothetical protein
MESSASDIAALGPKIEVLRCLLCLASLLTLRLFPFAVFGERFGIVALGSHTSMGEPETRIELPAVALVDEEL